VNNIVFESINLVIKMHKYLNSLHHTLKYPLPKYPSPLKT